MERCEAWRHVCPPTLRLCAARARSARGAVSTGVPATTDGLRAKTGPRATGRAMPLRSTFRQLDISSSRGRMQDHRGWPPCGFNVVLTVHIPPHQHSRRGFGIQLFVRHLCSRGSRLTPGGPARVQEAKRNLDDGAALNDLASDNQRNRPQRAHLQSAFWTTVPPLLSASIRRSAFEGDTPTRSGVAARRATRPSFCGCSGRAEIDGRRHL